MPAGVRARAHRIGRWRARLGRGGRDDGAEVVRQEPGADQRRQLRAAARRAAAGARGLPGRCDAPTPRSATSRATTTRTWPPARNAATTRCWPATGRRWSTARVLDALCRALGVSFYAAMRGNLAGHRRRARRSSPASTSAAFLAALRAGRHASTRATRSGMVDAITAADLRQPVNDGLPETLEQVVAALWPSLLQAQGRRPHRWPTWRA